MDPKPKLLATVPVLSLDVDEFRRSPGLRVENWRNG